MESNAQSDTAVVVFYGLGYGILLAFAGILMIGARHLFFFWFCTFTFSRKSSEKRTLSCSEYAGPY